MSDDHALETFVTALSGAETMDALQDVLSASMQNLGFRYASYHVIQLENGQPRLPYAITDYPTEWVEHYVREGYLQTDPVLRASPSQILPFMWSEAIDRADMSREQKRMFDEARAVQIYDGFSVPIHGHHGEYAAVTVIPEAEGASARKLVAEKQHLVHLMSLYFDRYARSPLVNAKMSTRRQKSLLSPREQEVLRWTAQGKTAGEIASIIGISAKSIEAHLESAKRKLGTYSKTHVVVKAMLLGLLKI